MKLNVKIYASLLVGFLVASSATLKGQESQIDYLGATPPQGDSLVIFAPGVVSVPHRWEEKIGFTADGKEVFFGNHGNAALGPDGEYFKPKLMHATFANGKWSAPKVLNFWPERMVAWPLLSQDGNTLFLEEVVKRTEQGGAIGQVVFAERTENSWSQLHTFTPNVLAKEGFGLGQITNDSTLYYHDRYDRIAYFSKWKDGKWTSPTQLSYKINPCVEFFVSPDDDYIIFKPLNWSNQFHISFKDQQGDWSMPVPFGAHFQSNKSWNGRAGYGPYVSPDGKYFFIGMKGDIYWIKADFIQALKRKSE